MTRGFARVWKSDGSHELSRVCRTSSSATFSAPSSATWRARQPQQRHVACTIPRPPAAWIVFNLGLAAVIVWRLATISHENASRVRKLALLLAATGTIRQLLQFSHLSFAFAIVGAFTASPLIGGLLVGLSLMKPQIGGVVWVWLVLRRQWRRAAYALPVPLILTAVYIAVAPIGLPDLAAGYGAAITSQYGDPTQLPGHSDLRIWLWRL